MRLTLKKDLYSHVLFEPIPNDWDMRSEAFKLDFIGTHVSEAFESVNVSALEQLVEALAYSDYLNKLLTLTNTIGHLNPNAGEIGEGMLRNIIDRAQELI